MTTKSTAWLCNYDDRRAFNIYGLRASFPDYVDAVSFYYLNKKDDNKALSDPEKIEFQKDLEKSMSIKKIWFAGEYIKEKNMPTQVYLEPAENLPKVNEVAFQIINGYLVVNKACYDVMTQFNLGKTHFSEVKIINLETNTKATEQPYYFINIAETREFLDSENSTGVRKSRNRASDSPVRFISDPKSNEIKLHNSVVNESIDLWHDPHLVRSLFLSNKMVNALFDAGIKESDLGLVRCSVNNK